MPRLALRPSRQPTRLLALLCVVAGLHALLLASFAPRNRPAATTRQGGAVTLLLRPALPTPRPEAMAPARVAGHRAAPQPAPARASRPLSSPPLRREPDRLSDAPADGPFDAPSDDAAGAAGGAPAAAEPAPHPSAHGEPPPVYPTRLPMPARLPYAAQVNGVAADAELHWQHDGRRYRLDLVVRGASRGLVEQHSEGGFDAAGVAPERFVDRRHGRLVGAAHFRRDIGRITFSGPSVDFPAWPGSMDRLAWLAQIAAVLAAAESPPEALRFFVADARGIARAWDFRSEGREPVETDAGTVQASKYVRDPQRPDDLRIAVWLDPAAGWWPVRIDFHVPIGNSRLSLLRRPIVAAPAPARTGS